LARKLFDVSSGQSVAGDDEGVSAPMLPE
jgi:hypothetical protein